MKIEPKLQLAALAATAFMGTPSYAQLPIPDDPGDLKSLAIDSSLYRAWDLSRTRSIPEIQPLVGGRSILSDDGMVHVEIVGPRGFPSIDPQMVVALGGRAETRWRHRLDAWVPVRRVVDLARAVEPMHRVVVAEPGKPSDVAGEGPGAIGSDSYRAGGADGSGLTIAIVDSGFNGLTAAQANGDAPSTYVARNYTGSAFESGSFHGTSCVEAAFDHCPGATWRLYRINSAADLGTTVADCIDNGVDVISHSLGWFNQGWADNSGDISSAAREAAEAGILFVTSGGNYQQKHWQGSFEAGLESTSWHDFGPGDELLSLTIPKNAQVDFYLQWDTAGNNTDLDLFMYDSSVNEIASSESGGESFEKVTWTNPNNFSVNVSLAVLRYSGSASPTFEIFGPDTAVWNEYIVSSSSTMTPANTHHDNVLSVAAVDEDWFYTDGSAIKSYSSLGPTNGGMTVPKVAGPTDTVSFTNPGGFTGTSCAAPNVAGAACAFWSSMPSYDADAISWLLREQAYRFEDWGATGADNTYGHGGASLVPFQTGTRFLSPAFENTAEANDGPNWSLEGAEVDVPAGGRVLAFPNGSTSLNLQSSSSSYLLLDKKLFLQGAGGPTVIE